MAKRLAAAIDKPAKREALLRKASSVKLGDKTQNRRTREFRKKPRSGTPQLMYLAAV